MQAPVAIEEAVALLRATGSSFNAIAAELNRRGLPGPHGGRWYGASVHRLLNGPQNSGQHRCTERCRLQERPCSQSPTPQQ
ncbi:MAG: recombinase family protein [Pseudomonadota bacterium]